MITETDLTRFLTESLGIEGIWREPFQEEITATLVFLHCRICNAATVMDLQQVYAPSMPLRDRAGMNVRVGNYTPPPGQMGMRGRLEDVLKVCDPWECHVAFEHMHPFMDGNGRTGRAIWAWKMLETMQNPFELSFLHRFYYQTLSKIASY